MNINNKLEWWPNWPDWLILILFGDESLGWNRKKREDNGKQS